MRNIIAVITPITIKEPPPVDISGRWRADETDKTPGMYFIFEVVDDKLFGNVWITTADPFVMSDPESGILNGKIVGDEYIKKITDPTSRADLISHYQGKIKGDEIEFSRQTESGHFGKFTAKKVVDKTKITSESHSSEIEDTYVLVYTLPGHEGGVRALSFGPDSGSFLSGGLRLASGGAQDGKINYWHLATAKLHDFDNIASESNEEFGAVYVAYNPEAGKELVFLEAVGVSKNGKKTLSLWSENCPTRACNGRALESRRRCSP